MKIDFLWIENPADETPDTMLTFAVVAFVFVLLKLAFGGSTLTLSHFVWNIQPIDSATIGTLLGSTLGAYVIRKYTDKKFDTDGDGIPDSNTPPVVKKEG